MSREPTPIPLPSLPRRDREGHKGDFGKVNIISGSVGYTGAPCLAAAGALRSGAGLVSVGVPGGIYPIVAAKLLCAMPYPLGQGPRLTSDALEEAVARCRDKDAVAIGPGLGSDPFTFELVRRLIRRVECPLVLDADGINALAGHIDGLDSRRRQCTVLTPHLGEFARLLGREVGPDRAAEAQDFATAHGCYLVLKGHASLVACPDGSIYVNQTGNPGMATGGSGDVLTGLCAGLLAQGLEPREAVTAAVYLHGLAGDLAAGELGEYAMTAGDLLNYLPQALRAAGG